jgi:hypothetical protein
LTGELTPSPGLSEVISVYTCGLSPGVGKACEFGMLEKSRRADDVATVMVQTEECVMKTIVTTLLRRSLMTLSAIVVWAKTLARGKADPVNAEDRSKDSDDGQQKPNREP